MPSTIWPAAGPLGSPGSQAPRIHSGPSYATSTGQEAIDLAALAGLELDEWQQWSLTESLGERPDGKWASFGVGLCVPRQNGKGGILEARELAGLFLLGERLIIHSAHQFDTSQEAFERLVALIENTPELSKRVAKRGIVRSHGSEGVKLKNGQRIRFRTRTKGGGRGFSCDCLILDEAMILPDAFISAVLSTLSARPNPQIWYTGSAVDQTIHEHGLVFTRVRERGIAGDEPSLFYAEWSAADHVDEITEEMALDPEVWGRANPALGIRISHEYVANERREFNTNLRGFAVERLGAGDWPDTSGMAARLITTEAWAACCDPGSQLVDPVTFALDVSPDRSQACIAAAGRRSDNLLHVEVVDHRRGTDWVSERLQQLLKAHRYHRVVLDSYGPAGSFALELFGTLDHDTKGKPKLHQATTKEYGQACGLFYDAVANGSLRHLGTDELTTAVNGATTKAMGDAWKWDRKSSDVDITPLVASTLALWGVAPKRTPQVHDLNEIVARLEAKRKRR